MNEYSKPIKKFQTGYATAYFLLIFFSLILIPLFSYLFDNYWLLFGIIFSFLGSVFFGKKIMILFYLLTIGIIIYWINYGFDFKQPITFYWFSFLIGNIIKSIINVCDKMIKEISNQHSSDIIENIKRGVDLKNRTIKNQSNG